MHCDINLVKPSVYFRTRCWAVFKSTSTSPTSPTRPPKSLTTPQSPIWREKFSRTRCHSTHSSARTRVLHTPQSLLRARPQIPHPGRPKHQPNTPHSRSRSTSPLMPHLRPPTQQSTAIPREYRRRLGFPACPSSRRISARFFGRENSSKICHFTGDTFGFFTGTNRRSGG